MDVPDIVYWVWGLTLAIAVFVILPIAVALLHRTLLAARSIERYFAEMRDAGVGIAKNTGQIKALDDTIAVATQILGTSSQIKEHTGAIEATLVGRVAGNGHG
jgi:hypothetical protein